MKKQALNIFVTISLALGLLLLSWGLVKIFYHPTEAEIGRALEGRELLIHKAKMRKHGIRNTEMVYRHWDGSEWYYNQTGKYCRFK